MKEKYSYYEFEIYSEKWGNTSTAWNKNVTPPVTGVLWLYRIFSTGCPPYDNGDIDSDEWFETEQEARFAAIGRIDQLENGEG
jgi:hypothetical protein